jgi:hypothetical protein
MDEPNNHQNNHNIPKALAGDQSCLDSSIYSSNSIHPKNPPVSGSESNCHQTPTLIQSHNTPGLILQQDSPDSAEPTEISDETVKGQDCALHDAGLNSTYPVSMAGEATIYKQLYKDRTDFSLSVNLKSTV